MKSDGRLATLPRDIFAGTVVFLVALPLCLGVANASGVAPISGLLAGIIGGLVIAVLSGSPLSVSGPAAGLIVIVADGMVAVGGFPAFLTAVLLAGVLQLVFGLLKAGRLAAYVPSPVIKGMLTAIGLLLVVKQLPVALGRADMPGSAAAASGAKGVFDTVLGYVSVTSIVVAAISLAIMLGWETTRMRRMALVRTVPAALVVVIFGIIATIALDSMAPQFAPLREQRVALPSLDSLAGLFGSFAFPTLSQIENLDVWRLAATLAIVASLETLLSLEALEQIDPEKRAAPPNRELVAQGVGNVIAGLLGALPLTAVIVRSSANVYAGARTRASAIVHGLLLLASVFMLTSVLNLIPLASLAAILIATGFKLAKPSLFISVAKRGAGAFAPFAVTIAGVLLTDLLIGIVLGIACSVALSITSSMRRPFTIAKHGNCYLLSFRKDASFLVKVALKRQLAGIPDNSTLIVDVTRVDFVDPDVHELIDDFAAESAGRGIDVQHAPHAFA